MSLYSTDHLTDSQLGALIEIMFLAAFADGEFSEQEQANFRDVIESLSDQRLSGEALSGHMLRAAMQLEAEGRAKRLAAACDELPDIDARRIALALAVDVARADGIEPAELSQLTTTAVALGIAPDELERLLR